MKNQYFGDINDYRKYGILRTLSNSGAIRIGICWMLTEDNNSNEGKFINYIHQPNRWRKYDPTLFDSLSDALTRLNKRNVELSEQLQQIDNSYYFTKYLKDSPVERELYFQEFKVNSLDCNMIFFDPDNGIEVKSKALGSKDSNKYLYWNEIQEIYQRGQSILIYQHFPRIKRDAFVENIFNKTRSKIETDNVIFFETSNVLFILIPQNKSRNYFFKKSKELEFNWHSEIKCRVFNNIYNII